MKYYFVYAPKSSRVARAFTWGDWNPYPLATRQALHYYKLYLQWWTFTSLTASVHCDKLPTGNNNNKSSNMWVRGMYLATNVDADIIKLKTTTDTRITSRKQRKKKKIIRLAPEWNTYAPSRLLLNEVPDSFVLKTSSVVKQDGREEKKRYGYFFFCQKNSVSLITSHWFDRP